MDFTISLVRHVSCVVIKHRCHCEMIHVSSYTLKFFISLVCIYSVGLTNLESLNLSFTVVTDGGLRKLYGLSFLKSLNLDARQITDAGLAALTSKECFDDIFLEKLELLKRNQHLH